MEQSSQGKSHNHVKLIRESLVRENGHFPRRLLPVYGSVESYLPCERDEICSPSQPWSANDGSMLCHAPAMEEGTTRQIVRGSYTRAENKRITGGSRRAIFGIPTLKLHDTRPSAARFSPEDFSLLRYSSHAAPIARVLVSAPLSSTARFSRSENASLRFSFFLFLSFSLSTSLSSTLYPVTARCGISSRWRTENDGSGDESRNVHSTTG